MPKRQVRYDNPIWDDMVAELGHDPRPYESETRNIDLRIKVDDAPFFTGTEFDLQESHTGELVEEKL